MRLLSGCQYLLEYRGKTVLFKCQYFATKGQSGWIYDPASKMFKDHFVLDTEASLLENVDKNLTYDDVLKLFPEHFV